MSVFIFFQLFVTTSLSLLDNTFDLDGEGFVGRMADKAKSGSICTVTHLNRFYAVSTHHCSIRGSFIRTRVRPEFLCINNRSSVLWSNYIPFTTKYDTYSRKDDFAILKNEEAVSDVCPSFRGINVCSEQIEGVIKVFDYPGVSYFNFHKYELPLNHNCKYKNIPSLICFKNDANRYVKTLNSHYKGAPVVRYTKDKNGTESRCVIGILVNHIGNQLYAVNFLYPEYWQWIMDTTGGNVSESDTFGGGSTPSEISGGKITTLPSATLVISSSRGTSLFQSSFSSSTDNSETRNSSTSVTVTPLDDTVLVNYIYATAFILLFLMLLICCICSAFICCLSVIMR
ncbi:uncharacterized protein LOC142348636 [Convolutriloba macropyga]|uniref:uncharacterized protein LOC142348636 n=1 Tax=Convolutriloba macropyga TaxID=536237 RepID=UPI003F51E7EB